MAKSADQKLKILYVLELLREKSDARNPVSMSEILDYLEQHEITAERKSIYSDITALKEFGYDIINKRSNPQGYYLNNRDFDIGELKLLIDAVQACKFITDKKSKDLIEKLEKLASKSDKKLINHHIYVDKRNKTDSTQVIECIDIINEAIIENYRIEFTYGEWSEKKILIPRHDGQKYQVDPIVLVWDDENYYLVGYDAMADKIKHFRVDKIMGRPNKTIKIKKSQEILSFDAAIYASKHFGMFSGEERTVSFSCDASFIGVMIDRFGKDITILKMDGNKLKVRATVQVSNTFFGWLTGLGGKVMIESPGDVRDQYKQFLENIIRGI